MLDHMLARLMVLFCIFCVGFACSDQRIDVLRQMPPTSQQVGFFRRCLSMRGGGSHLNPLGESNDAMIGMDGNDVDARGSQLQSNRRRDEVVKLMVQAMDSMGFMESARTLEAESGIALSEGAAAAVKQLSDAILDGNWELATALMHEAGWAGFRVRYPVYRQEFLELLETGQREAAAACFASKLRPAARTTRLRKDLKLLAGLQTLPRSRIQAESGWEGRGLPVKMQVAAEALRHVPGHVLPPRRRLFDLLDQLEAYQRNASLFPYTEEEEYSLLEDPAFAPQKLPRLLRTIALHRDEVWAVRFSPSGRLLATGGKDRKLLIWEASSLTDGSIDAGWGLRPEEEEEEMPGLVVSIAAECQVVDIAWSPDESAVVVAGWEENFLRVFAVATGEKRHCPALERDRRVVVTCVVTRGVTWAGQLGVTSRMHRPIASVAWVPGTELCAAGGGDERLLVWSMEGLLARRPLQEPPASVVEPAAQLETGGRAVQSLAGSGDGRLLVALLSEQVLRVYEVHALLAVTEALEEEGGGAEEQRARWPQHDMGGEGGLLQTAAIVNPLLASLQANQAWDTDAPRAGSQPPPGAASPGQPPPTVHAWLEVVVPVDGLEALLSVRMKRYVTDSSESGDPTSPHTILLNAIAAGGQAECIEWDLDRRRTAQRYRGHIAERFVPDSVIGGHQGMLVAGGDENGGIVLWHRHTGQRVKMLLGHTAAVNQLDWHGAGGGILVSGSDDHTIKVWGQRLDAPASSAEK